MVTSVDEPMVRGGISGPDSDSLPRGTQMVMGRGMVVRNQLVKLGLAALTAALVAGCDGGRATADAASTTAVRPSATPVLQSGTTAGPDEATKKACASLGKDIKATQKQIVEVDRSGEPNEHRAVSAAYSAGAGKLLVSMRGADGRVTAAAKEVAAAFKNLAGEYSTASEKAPNTVPLTSAIKELGMACTGQ
jgi:hypothetical protein